MAIDKVRPLKIENPSEGGTQTDPFPTEMNPTQDYVATAGISFEGTDTFLAQKVGRVLLNLEPDSTCAVTYGGNGAISVVEYFNSPTQITANRIARVDLGYTVAVDPLTETWKYYSSDGTTILRTITITYTYTGTLITSAAMVTT